jgi:hypothetical protein
MFFCADDPLQRSHLSLEQLLYRSEACEAALLVLISTEPADQLLKERVTRMFDRVSAVSTQMNRCGGMSSLLFHALSVFCSRATFSLFPRRFGHCSLLQTHR